MSDINIKNGKLDVVTSDGISSGGLRTSEGQVEITAEDNYNSYVISLDTKTLQMIAPRIDINTISGIINIKGLPIHPDNATAISGGLGVNDVYKTSSGELRIVH